MITVKPGNELRGFEVLIPMLELPCYAQGKFFESNKNLYRMNRMFTEGIE